MELTSNPFLQSFEVETLGFGFNPPSQTGALNEYEAHIKSLLVFFFIAGWNTYVSMPVGTLGGVYVFPSEMIEIPNRHSMGIAGSLERVPSSKRRQGV